MLNSLRTFVAFSCGDKSNADYAADCLGGEKEELIETLSKGTTERYGKMGNRGNTINKQCNFRLAKNVLASELFELGKGQAFLRLPGFPVARLQFDQVTLAKKYPHESLAAWVTKKETRIARHNDETSKAKDEKIESPKGDDIAEEF